MRERPLHDDADRDPRADEETNLGLDLVDEVATTKRRRRPVPVKRAALFAIAAAVLVAGVLAIVVAMMPRDIVGEVRDASDVVTGTTEYEDGGTATLSVSAEADAGFVELSDFPEPESGLVYQAWVVDANTGNHSPLEPFETDAEDPVVGFQGLRDVVEVDITIEPVGEAGIPTTEPILSLPVPTGE
ncbi:anti-sigma factor [Zhihengliuella halotolerans]|uniref:Anti-sigma-K factor rskA n=1 Tax=Zhihengliuella halotolerans TaxID=370736 RepID=A0A4Q8ABL5_9MICC|nr:anti-sigma factor [Zhihengliuella halotolerans]RZU61061.1 anti-sigma-K factor rskA [Zhihengliuella halotolerans]